MTTDLYAVKNGELNLYLHNGQWKAWNSRRRIVAVVAGTQSGKTSFAPLWLYKEIRERGAGDYGFIAPTFRLLELKALPEFRRFFEDVMRLGEYHATPVPHFAFSTDGATRTFGSTPDRPTAVFFGYAANPDSLESATYKAVVCDEAGQQVFKRGSWEAIQRRVAIHEGRILICTTPYPDSQWLRSEIIDKFHAGDPTIDLISFASTMNPSFPKVELERAKQSLPDWKFRMFYMGQMTRPAGLIYDCFGSAQLFPAFDIPHAWRRYLGADFGGVHTAAVFIAQDPDSGRLYVYREYLEGGRTSKQHTAAMLQGEPGVPIAVGGSHSEGQWRSEFRAGGLPIREPDQKLVEVGIDRTYAAFREGMLLVSRDCPGLIDELQHYSRETDENGDPTEEIANKSTFHRLDALRYIVSYLRRPIQQARGVKDFWG
jgi:hypothetical protein